eukprot:508069-Pelagomonas_calceolata.AAC.1
MVAGYRIWSDARAEKSQEGGQEKTQMTQRGAGRVGDLTNLRTKFQHLFSYVSPSSASCFRKGKGYIAGEFTYVVFLFLSAYVGSLAEVKTVPVTKALAVLAGGQEQNI